MALKLADLKAEITASDDYMALDQKAWEAKIEQRDIIHRSQKDFDALIPIYVEKIDGIRKQLREAGFDIKIVPQTSDGKAKTSEEIVAEMNQQMEQLNYLTQKETRLMDKLAVCLKEVELREKGLVAREGIHDAADYYIDYTNGIDTAAGTKQGNFTTDAGTDTTTIVDAELNGLTITDNAASSGDFVWNVTRGAGSYVDSWNDATDTIVLTGAIAGQTTGDTYYILSSWKTISKYTTTTIRLAGDRAFLRANITWPQGTLATDIVFDEKGSIDAYISIIGCDDTTNDPWNDNSNTKPIIDFEDGAYQAVLNGDDYWWIERVDFRQSADTVGMFWVTSSYGNYFKSCDFSDTVQPGLRAQIFTLTIDGCTFSDLHIATGQIYYAGPGILHAKNCTFNHGAGAGSDYAVTMTGGGILYCYDCSFGETTQFDNSIIKPSAGATCYWRNCTYTGTLFDILLPGFTFYSEDNDGTFEAQYSDFYPGTAVKATASPFAGGADSYATMTPNANCGLLSPLRLGDNMCGFSRIWMASGAEKTVTVKARVGSAWDTALLASEAYLVASYLDSADDCGRTEVQSTQQIANDGSATSFTVTFTPQKTGWVYLWFYLAQYEDATEYIDVDIKPVVS